MRTVAFQADCDRANARGRTCRQAPPYKARSSQETHRRVVRVEQAHPIVSFDKTGRRTLERFDSPAGKAGSRGSAPHTNRRGSATFEVRLRNCTRPQTGVNASRVEDVRCRPQDVPCGSRSKPQSSAGIGTLGSVLSPRYYGQVEAFSPDHPSRLSDCENNLRGLGADARRKRSRPPAEPFRSR